MITDSRESTQKLGISLARILRVGDILLLYGDLGAGKTTLVQGIAQGLGVMGEVSSPTFTILHEHLPCVTSVSEDGLLKADEADSLSSAAVVLGMRSGQAASNEFLGSATRLDGVATKQASDISAPSRGIPLYHFDCYRLSGAEEWFDSGFDEYLFGAGIVVIEWPERVEAALPDTALCLSLHHVPAEPELRIVEIDERLLARGMV